MGDLSIDLSRRPFQVAAADPWPVRVVVFLAVTLSKEANLPVSGYVKVVLVWLVTRRVSVDARGGRGAKETAVIEDGSPAELMGAAGEHADLHARWAASLA